MKKETTIEKLEALCSRFKSEEAEVIKSAIDELSQIRDDTKSSNNHRNKFLSLVAHDLKSPLASITGTLDILTDELDDSLNPKQKQVLEIAVNSCELMARMIEELLNFSKLKFDKIELLKMSCDLSTLAGSILDLFSLPAGKRGVKMVNNIPQGVKVFVDFNLFFKVLQNLVSNAVKFCKEGDTITLYVLEGEGLTVAVSDTGVGIPKDTLCKLFLEDERTSTVGTDGERGNGLGLPFCREVMQMHGGCITVESEVGVGSTFFATLPLLVTD